MLQVVIAFTDLLLLFEIQLVAY